MKKINNYYWIIPVAIVILFLIMKGMPGIGTQAIAPIYFEPKCTESGGVWGIITNDQGWTREGCKCPTGKVEAEYSCWQMTPSQACEELGGITTNIFQLNPGFTGPQVGILCYPDQGSMDADRNKGPNYESDSLTELAYAKAKGGGTYGGCLVDSDCIRQRVSNTNDCSLSWKPEYVTEQGICMCSGAPCFNTCMYYTTRVIPSPKCTDWQLWLQQNKLYFFGGIIAILILGYFVFEIGPNKGFFRRR